MLGGVYLLTLPQEVPLDTARARDAGKNDGTMSSPQKCVTQRSKNFSSTLSHILVNLVYSQLMNKGDKTFFACGKLR